MVALPARDTLENTYLARRDTPRIGGSSAAFVVIIVVLVLVIVIACVAIAVLLREEARENPQPSERGWRFWLSNLFGTQTPEPSSPIDRIQRLSVISQKGQGWIQAGQEGDWESKHFKGTPAVSPNSTIASRGKGSLSPHDSILPSSLFRPSTDMTTSEPSTPPIDGSLSAMQVSSPPAAHLPPAFETFIPNVRSHLSASPSLSTVATYYTHAGSEAIVNAPSSNAHESERSPVTRTAARGSKFIESL